MAHARLKEHLISLAVGAAVAIVALCAIVIMGGVVGCAATPKAAGEKETLDAARAHATEAEGLRGELRGIGEDARIIVEKLKQ